MREYLIHMPCQELIPALERGGLALTEHVNTCSACQAAETTVEVSPDGLVTKLNLRIATPIEGS